MPRTKELRGKRKNALILKEQKQLLSIQKEIEEILNKINDSINVLKVEELQLKSSAVLFDNPVSSNVITEKSTDIPLHITPIKRNLHSLNDDTPSTFSDWTQQSNVMETAINRQQVDLDINSWSHMQQEVEEDDE